MNKTAIAFSTKDRVALTKQTVQPLLQPDRFDLFWVDGSKTEEGQRLPFDVAHPCSWHAYGNVTGGADAAIVFSLTTMLQHPNNYSCVGLVENDVLLDTDWFDATMALFQKGYNDGLEVGAVSARCYVDRILIQRDEYAVMHNLGAGMVIFSRKAAELVLKYFRTGRTPENRRAFMQTSGLDIARWSAFCRDEHPTCADWQFDRVLAQHGLASLALTPSRCEMIGQVPSLEEQGLEMARVPVEERRNDAAFDTFVSRTELIRNGRMALPVSLFQRGETSDYMIFPHQIELLGGGYEGEWQLKWSQGFGPFSWKAANDEKSPTEFSHVNIPLSGPCTLLVSGGDSGGRINVRDEMSGFDMDLDIVPEGDQQQVMQVQVPAGISYRNIKLTALTPGIVFYGMQVHEPQPVFPDFSFNHSMLAKA